MSDIRASKMCVAGTKKFFDSHGLDFREFLKSGIDEEKLLQSGDRMALIVVEDAHGRFKQKANNWIQILRSNTYGFVPWSIGFYSSNKCRK